MNSYSCIYDGCYAGEISVHNCMIGENVVIKKLVDVSVDEDVCIIGTMFKKMDMRPNILKEVSDVVSVSLPMTVPSIGTIHYIQYMLRRSIPYLLNSSLIPYL